MKLMIKNVTIHILFELCRFYYQQKKEATTFLQKFYSHVIARKIKKTQARFNRRGKIYGYDQALEHKFVTKFYCSFCSLLMNLSFLFNRKMQQTHIIWKTIKKHFG